MEQEICYRPLRAEELTEGLLTAFVRRQEVTACWRKVAGEWRLFNLPFVDDWSQEERRQLERQLRTLVEQGGLVYGAFAGEELRGFCAVKAGPMALDARYRDLRELHVSQELRGQGVGSRLFAEAKAWAKAQGGEALYISAHSCQETVAFYRRRGCVEAPVPDPAHVAAEPCDCQLICPV